MQHYPDVTRSVAQSQVVRYSAKVFVASGNAIRRFAIPDSSIECQITEAQTYEPCDIAIVYGTVRDMARVPALIATRASIFERHAGPLIVAETGFIGRQFKPRFLSRIKSLLGIRQRAISISPYYRMGIGGAFADDGDFCNANSPPDRWENLKRELRVQTRPLRKEGEHVLLIGQGPETNQWLIDSAQGLRSHTDRPVRVRLHPRMRHADAASTIRSLKRISGVSISDRPTQSIWNDLENCWSCVTFSSNACVEALIAGVPPICISPASIGHAVSSTRLDEVENPQILDDREAWFRNLAYAQWNDEEMASGRAWQHLKKNVLTALST